MTELLLLALGASLVNHFVSTNRPGPRQAAGTSRAVEEASLMGLATLGVLPLACGTADLISRGLLTAAARDGLDTLLLLLVIAVLAPITAAALRSLRPAWREPTPGFVPLLAMNGALLGVGFVRIGQRHSGLESLGYGAFAAATFALVLVAFAALEERVATGDAPQAWRGAPITLVTAGILALAFGALGTR